MPKFRIKPASAIVEVVQFQPDAAAPAANLPAGVRYDGVDYDKVPHWSIPTTIGNFRVVPGDYIVTGPLGVSIVKPDVIAEILEAA